METSNWKVSVPQEHIAIDADWQAINRNYKATLGLVGDAKDMLAAIIQKLEERSVHAEPSYLQEVLSLRNEVRAQLRKRLDRMSNL